MKATKFSIIAAAVMPALAFAQTFDTLLTKISTWISTAVPIAMTLALLYFIWGLAKYILSAGDPAAASKGKSIMIYGVIALFVMSAVWGLTAFIGNTLGLGQGQAPSASQLLPSDASRPQTR